jgi:DNA-binding response OmpR family regulator
MTAPAKHVLIVEDEDSIRQTLRYNLSQEGFVISEASTGTEALSAARRQRPDLILLDLMLPELSGLEVCRILRQEMTVPIIMLTAKGSELDKVVGLHVGADDYVTKPFSLNELLARVSAMLRRAEMSGKERVDVDGEELHLAPKEFDLLSLLLLNAGKVQSRQVIIQRIWGSKFYGDHKTVDVHVRWLREKFERFDRLPFRITTVFGVGYRIDRLDQAS